jgi:hypothetical protein
LGSSTGSRGEECRIDDKSLATPFQFVANQSTKLKIVTSDKLQRRFKELLDTRDKILKELNPSGIGR